MKTEGSSGDRSDLAVETLRSPVAESRSYVLEDTFDVLLDRNALDHRAAIRPKLLEDGAQRVRVLAFLGPHDNSSYMIDDNCDVLVVSPTAELVDADVAKSLEAIRTGIEVLSHHPGEDAADGPPGHPQQLSETKT